MAALCTSMCVSPLKAHEQYNCDSRVCVERLEDLTIGAMRREQWQGSLGTPIPLKDTRVAGTDSAVGEAGGGVGEHSETFMVPYWSDDLRQYARLDLPSTASTGCGSPLVLFIHGWAGIEAAPGYDFALNSDGLYGEIIAALTEAGFAVLYPGLRGHGTVDDRPADGIEFLEAWDTGSYLSPVFYARDVLNLLEATHELGSNGCTQPAPGSVWSRVDTRVVSLLAHSQGGDTLLTALAIAGDNPRVKQRIGAASIWAGNIPDRFTQANTFGPMDSTLQAFLSGDGTWTGSAVGRNGRVNPDFVFPWPSDWIGTLDLASSDWNWQAEQWSVPDVKTALANKYGEMYATVNRHVAELGDARFTIGRNGDGRLEIVHDPEIAELMPRIGGSRFGRFVRQPLHLHYSDRDYYSLPVWNEALAAEIQAHGGNAETFEYPGTNHSLKVSRSAWFSPPGTQDGASLAIRRDIALFKSVLHNEEVSAHHGQ